VPHSPKGLWVPVFQLGCSDDPSGLRPQRGSDSIRALGKSSSDPAQRSPCAFASTDPVRVMAGPSVPKACRSVQRFELAQAAAKDARAPVVFPQCGVLERRGRAGAQRGRRPRIRRPILHGGRCFRAQPPCGGPPTKDAVHSLPRGVIIGRSLWPLLSSPWGQARSDENTGVPRARAARICARRCPLPEHPFQKRCRGR
jgi:hypothetical protein